jgi:predicted small metal-binding protein
VRVIDCDCGTTLKAANDDDLVTEVTQHVAEHHPDQEMSEDEARSFVQARAYDADDA